MLSYIKYKKKGWSCIPISENWGLNKLDIPLSSLKAAPKAESYKIGMLLRLLDS